VAWGVLEALGFSPLQDPLCDFICYFNATMPLSSVTTSNLVDILRSVVETKQTGYVKLTDGAQEGCVAVENGNILHAKTGSARGLPALFQFVSWRDARIDFHERPMPTDLVRDLASYESHVLLSGIAFKVDEQNLLLEATPALDDVLRYVESDAISSVEITPSDVKLFDLADGRHTVREIAEQVNLNPTDVARQLARFRLAGLLEVVPPRPPSRHKMAA
jgi:hypothetical protein